MATLSLDASVSVVLDANGNGTASLGPTVVREQWQPSNIAVSATTFVNDAQCNVYLGTTLTAGQLLSTTSTGSSGDSLSPDGITMQSGMLLIAKWTGGDAGATATMSVFGTRIRP